MPRYYFDIVNHTRTDDTVGEEHPDTASALRAASVILAEVALDEARLGNVGYSLRVVIHTDQGPLTELTCKFWEQQAGGGTAPT